eukprot:6183697-Pleurochrysis_carterae.AAC.1
MGLAARKCGQVERSAWHLPRGPRGLDHMHERRRRLLADRVKVAYRACEKRVLLLLVRLGQQPPPRVPKRAVEREKQLREVGDADRRPDRENGAL